QAQILELLRDLQRRLSMSILLITHDLGVVAENADRVVVMYAGQVVETASVLEIFARPMHPYTRGLLDCIPQVEPARGSSRRRLRPIEGIVPDLRDIPEGCRFAERCPLRVAVCANEPPIAGVVPGGEGRGGGAREGRP